MKTSITVLFLGVLMGFGMRGPALAQTALDRVESRVRQQLGGAKPETGTVAQAPASGVNAPPQPQPPAGPAKAGGQGWLGVVADDENDRGRGVRVLEVNPDGPAAKAGFKPQDLITTIGTIRVRQMSEVADMLEMYKPGDVVTFEVQRDGKAQKLQATLAPRPAQRAALPGTAPAESKPAEPMLLPPQAAPATPPGRIPNVQSDDRGRIELLEQRVQQLEQRVTDLERALKQAAPGK
jgi:membrane-associated protease RseP (regulator of RpoE activity)